MSASVLHIYQGHLKYSCCFQRRSDWEFRARSCPKYLPPPFIVGFLSIRGQWAQWFALTCERKYVRVPGTTILEGNTNRPKKGEGTNRKDVREQRRVRLGVCE